MKREQTFRRRRKKTAVKQLNRESIQDAVDEYLKKGGKITRIESVSGTLEQIEAKKEKGLLFEDYLMDQYKS